MEQVVDKDRGVIRIGTFITKNTIRFSFSCES